MVEDTDKCFTTDGEQVSKQAAKATVVASMEQKDLSHEHLYELLTSHSGIIFANADHCGRL